MRASDDPRSRAELSDPCAVPRIDTGPAAASGPGVVRDDRSIGQLIKELRDETQALLRKEVKLAQTEISEKVSRVARNVAYIAVGGVILYSALLVLLIAATCAVVLGLRAVDVTPVVYSWLAPLIVGLILAAIGGAMLAKGVNTLRRESMVPEKTVASIQENKEWIEHKIK